MKKTVGDFVLERISLWGVTRLFGYPGDGIARGDSDRGAIIAQLYRQWAA